MYMKIEFNQKIFIIILITIGIYYLMSYRENKICLDDNYLEEFIKQNKLKKKIYNSIFKINKNYYDDNKITLIKFLNKEGNDEQNIIIKNINTIMNNNRKYDIYNDYNITENTTLGQIRNSWLQDNILNKFICETDKKKIEILNNYFISLITASYVKICTKEALILQCSELVNKSLKKGGEEEEKKDIADELTKDKKQLSKIEDKVDKVIENMTNFISINTDRNLVENLENTNIVEFEVNNLEKILQNVNTSSFGDLEKPYLIKYINMFEKKFNKTFDFKTLNNIVKIVIFIVPDSIKLAKQIKVLSRSDKRKIKLVKKFIPLRSLFYKLKHFFKQLSYYNIVDAYIKDPEDREIAMSCCQSTQDENKCFNFSKKRSMSEPIIMGFYTNEKESIGYIKESKCLLPSRSDEVDIQQQELFNVLNTNNIFNSFSSDIKKTYMKDMIDYLKYFKINIKNGNVTIGDLLQNIKPNLKKGLKDKYNNIPKLNKNKINEIFSYNNKYVNKLINRINKENNIDKLENIMKAIKSNFDFRSLSDIDRIKYSMIYLLKLNYIFTSLGLTNTEANNMIKQIFVIQEDKTFEEIFEKSLINKRFHSIIVKTIADMLIKDKNIVIKKTLTPKSNVMSIIFKKLLFPVNSELNICNSWKDVLDIHRRERTINPDNYLELKNKIIKLCNSKDRKFESLKSDRKITIEKEIKIAEIKDVNNVKHKILFKEDKNKKVIVKKIDGKYIETGKVILKNNQILDKNNKIDKKEILVDNSKGEKIKIPIVKSEVKINNEKVLDKIEELPDIGLYIVKAEVIDINKMKKNLAIYLRREKDFDKYIFLDDYNPEYMPKYTMDENFKFYIYNKLYTKNRVRLLGIDKKEITVKIKNKKLKGFKIIKKDLVREYKSFDKDVSNVLKNKLFHFFGKFN